MYNIIDLHRWINSIIGRVLIKWFGPFYLLYSKTDLLTAVTKYREQELVPVANRFHAKQENGPSCCNFTKRIYNNPQHWFHSMLAVIFNTVLGIYLFIYLFKWVSSLIIFSSLFTQTATNWNLSVRDSLPVAPPVTDLQRHTAPSPGEGDLVQSTSLSCSVFRDCCWHWRN